MTIRILLVDDHSVVRKGLRTFLTYDPELEVVGEAADGAEALTLARELLSLLDPQRNVQMRTELNEVMKNLGEPGASMRAAQAVMRFIERDSATQEQE